MVDGQLTTVYHGLKAGSSGEFHSHEAQVLDHGSHASHEHMNHHTIAPVDAAPAPLHEGHDAPAMPHHDHGGSSHRDHGGGGGGHTMSMAFHAGDTETILFNFWRTESAWALTLSCLVIFLVAILYEGLKFYREWLFERSRRRLQGGRDYYGDSRRYREYKPPTYSYRQPPPPQQQSQGQTTQIYAYHPGPAPSMPPHHQPCEAAIPPSAQPSQVFPRQPTAHAGHHHIQQLDPESGGKVPCRRRWCSRLHLVQTFLHVLQVFISFLLMLVFMTFNVWLCVAVLLGAGVGYYIFGAFSTRINEHCN